MKTLPGLPSGHALVLFWLLLLSPLSVLAKPGLSWQLQARSPAKSIPCILQTKDGYLWMGTYNGLIRSDGIAYTLFDSSNVSVWHDVSVTALYEADDGSLWIGHAKGDVSHEQNERFSVEPAPAAFSGTKIQALTQDAKGNLWVLYCTGVLRRLKDGLEARPASVPAWHYLSLTRTSDKSVWLTADGVLYRLEDDGELRQVLPGSPSPGLLQPGLIQGASPASDGGLWLVADGKLWSYKDQEARLISDSGDLQGTAIVGILETQDHLLCVATSEKGVVFIDPSRHGEVYRSFNRRSGWLTDWICAIARDSEGALWLGTGGAGLFKLMTPSVAWLTPADEWQGRAVLTTCQGDGGTLWVGTEGAGLYRYDVANEWTPFRQNGRLSSPYVWALANDHQGNLWIGSWEGLDRLRKDTLVAVDPPEGLPTPIFSILPVPDGGLWIGGALGVVYYKDGHSRWLEKAEDRRLLDARALLLDGTGTLWISTNGAGLGELKDGKLRRYEKKDGLSSDFLRGLCLDSEGNLWIATQESGLNRMRQGRLTSISIANGIPDNAVAHIENDGLGYLWVSSRSGLFRVNEKELNQCADGARDDLRCITYDEQDGMRSARCAYSQQAPGCRLPSGELVFASDSGLVALDARTPGPNKVPPPVVVEQVVAGDQRYSARQAPAEGVTVKAGETRLEFQYTALSFSHPEIMCFRYRLVGVDTSWIKAGTERHAVYNNLTPGTYEFQVLAANSGGWNQEGARLQVTIPPHFWQMTWFKVSATLLVLSLAFAFVWFLSRHRLERRMEALRLQSALAAERARIASDVHDDLGSNLTKIAMIADTARRDIADKGKLEMRLDSIYDSARGLAKAMDEIVWAINPRHDTMDSLLSYLEIHAVEFFRTGPISAEFEFPLDPPTMNPCSEYRHNLFLAYKEALANVVRHSGASRVLISVEFSGDRLCLSIADNGRGRRDQVGMPSPNSRPARERQGNGLANMAARMAAIHGHCRVEWPDQGGCIVRLHTPFSSIHGQLRTFA